MTCLRASKSAGLLQVEVTAVATSAGVQGSLKWVDMGSKGFLEGYGGLGLQGLGFGLKMIEAFGCSAKGIVVQALGFGASALK